MNIPEYAFLCQVSEDFRLLGERGTRFMEESGTAKFYR
jgi:hypothetical protein